MGFNRISDEQLRYLVIFSYRWTMLHQTIIWFEKVFGVTHSRSREKKSQQPFCLDEIRNDSRSFHIFLFFMNGLRIQQKMLRLFLLPGSTIKYTFIQIVKTWYRQLFDTTVRYSISSSTVLQMCLLRQSTELQRRILLHYPPY